MSHENANPHVSLHCTQKIQWKPMYTHKTAFLAYFSISREHKILFFCDKRYLERTTRIESTQCSKKRFCFRVKRKKIGQKNPYRKSSEKKNRLLLDLVCM